MEIERIDDMPKVCDNCMNNPKNNPLASGVCCCTLPSMFTGGTQVVTSDKYTVTTGVLERSK